MKAKRSETHLTGAVRVDLIKPLNMTWEEVGPHLFDLRDVAHRLVNAGLRACYAGPVDDEKKLGVRAREAIDAQLREYKAWNSTMAAKPNGATHFSRRAELVPTGVMLDAWRQRAQQMYQGKVADMLRGDASLPTVRKGTPIGIRDGSWKIREEGAGYTLSLPLFAGRAPRIEWAIGVSGGGAHAHIRRMLGGGDVKLGDVKILRDERKGKWFALLSYSWPKPESVGDVGRIMVARRGITSILTAASSDGWFGRWQPATFRPGDEPMRPSGVMLLDARRKFQARRASISRRSKDIGVGARGHGEARRLEAIRKLDDAEARFVKTMCQQAASWLVTNARARGCGTIAVEDFSTIEDDDKMSFALLRRWPWAQLKGAILWAAKKSGIAVLDVSSAGNTRTCPADGCGHVHKAAQLGKFRCVACGYERPADYVAALNMLRAVGANDGALEIDNKVRRARARLSEA